MQVSPCGISLLLCTERTHAGIPLQGEYKVSFIVAENGKKVKGKGKYWLDESGVRRRRSYGHISCKDRR